VSLGEETWLYETAWREGRLPPRYDSPVDVPFTCTKAKKQGVYPDCRYFSFCWPELPSEGSFDLE
jgi:hypothetical protein